MSRRENIRALIEASRSEAADLVKLVAEPRAPGETIKTCISRAASRLGWSYNRTGDIWRQEARRIDAYEMDQLRRAKVAKRRRKAGIRIRK